MHGLLVTDMHEQKKGKHCKSKTKTTNQWGQPDLEHTRVNKIFNTILHSEAWAPFLESPGNVSGLKTNLQIEI